MEMPATDSHPPEPGSGIVIRVRRLFLLVGAVILVDTMFYPGITPLLPTYRDDLGLTKTAAGVMSASYAAGTLIGSLPVGLLVARLGAKPTLLVGPGGQPQLGHGAVPRAR